MITIEEYEKAKEIVSQYKRQLKSADHNNRMAYEKFYNKIGVDGDCWIWSDLKNYRGYGKFYAFGREWRAHRFSYLMHKGEIPEGLFVCHECDNPSCVNPDHLWLGTNQQNMIDASKKGRLGLNKSKTKRAKHPSVSAYSQGCRCEGCLEMGRQYHKNRKAIKKLIICD